MNKTIITVVGKDAVGIIAAVCTYLSGKNINILDISQTIVDGYFNMMMITDTTDCGLTHEELCRDLGEVGKKKGVVIHAQREEIFDMMHRV